MALVVVVASELERSPDVMEAQPRQRGPDQQVSLNAAPSSRRRRRRRRGLGRRPRERLVIRRRRKVGEGRDSD